MKRQLFALGLLFTLTSVSQAFGYDRDTERGLQDARNDCNLNYNIVNPYDLGSQSQFPSPIADPVSDGTGNAPSAPSVGVISAKESLYRYRKGYQLGRLECQEANRQLQRSPRARVACQIRNGQQGLGYDEGADIKSAAAATVRNCTSWQSTAKCFSYYINCYSKQI